jgi:hypothetical protein
VGNSSQERMTEPGETKHEGVAADRSLTGPRFTVAEFAAFLGLEEHIIREWIERRPNKREYYSIGELADRWRVSRGTVYNRLRSTGAKVLDFASSGRR